MNTTSQAAQHEPATIKAFVVPDKQQRFLGFLAKPKTRKKLVRELYHFRWFDLRFAAPVLWKVDPTLKLWERHLQGIANIHRLLRSKGAGQTCWIISGDPEFDGREADLEWAIKKVIGNGMGTILSCIPGRLALFVGEDEMLVLSK